jgi:hypothetical protein
VIINFSGSARNGGGSNFSGLNFRLSGPTSRAAVDGEQAFVQGTTEAVVSKDNPVTGLTPGGAYTTR